ncbi:MAG: uncharacterized protein QOG80_711 [Pseudonocardiales bacterium]|jgi:hypothetical protein|nr:uncharacterized protein [Pseudonocardiales bacterium]
MQTAVAHIATARATRYLVQFCEHARAMGGGHGGARMHLGAAAHRDVQVHAEWSDTRGVITFTPWGQCTLTAAADALTLRIEATDEEGLGKIQDVITRDLDRFGRRDRLTVAW